MGEMSHRRQKLNGQGPDQKEKVEASYLSPRVWLQVHAHHTSGDPILLSFKFVKNRRAPL